MNCPTNTRHLVRAFIFWLFISPRFLPARRLQRTRKIKKVTKRSQIILCFQRAAFLFRKANSFLLGQTDRKIYCINPKKSIYNTVSKKQKTALRRSTWNWPRSGRPLSHDYTAIRFNDFSCVLTLKKQLRIVTTVPGLDPGIDPVVHGLKSRFLRRGCAGRARA